jgi:LysM repeat protein
MDQFRSLNNIKNDFVYPGQKVVVSGGSSTNTSSTTTVSTASTASQSSGGTYTVAAGDSVWSIANKHGISMDQFRSLNNIKNDFVYPGQKVVVSGSSATRTSTTTSTTVSSQTSSSAAGNTYTVAAGDSVWSVANKHGISMDQFRNWNNIKNDFIYPGQKVVVKQGGTTATTSTSATNGTYKVASGDSVWGIADKFGITTDQFIQWNNIQNNFIYPGQTVRVK